MKKWMLPALAVLLMAFAAGCDKEDTPPVDLPDTVDGLTVVTTSDEETTAAPVTEEVSDMVTEADEIETNETEPPETESLSSEEVDALLDSLLTPDPRQWISPFELYMNAEIQMTAHMFGSSGTTTVPLSGYYGTDADGDMMVAYAVPMKGTGACIVTGDMLYLHDGAETALKAPLDDKSLDEVKEILWQRLNHQFGSFLPEGGFPAWVPSGEIIPKSGMSALPTDGMDLSSLFGNAFATIPLKDAFLHVSAYREVETGTVILTLSGLSTELFDVVDAIINAIPEVETDLPAGTAGMPSFDPAVAHALVALLREQAETVLTVSFTADSELTVKNCTVTAALDMTSMPELTANMPVEVECTLRFDINRDNIAIEAPENADLYTEVALKDLLPTEPEIDGAESLLTPDHP